MSSTVFDRDEKLSTSVESKHIAGRRWEVRCDIGCRPAQLPKSDVPTRYDDDEFDGMGVWTRIPMHLQTRIMERFDDNTTFIEALEYMLK